VDVFVENDVSTVVEWSDREYDDPAAIPDDHPPGLDRVQLS
jgi:hypothetical protein